MRIFHWSGLRFSLETINVQLVRIFFLLFVYFEWKSIACLNIDFEY